MHNAICHIEFLVTDLPRAQTFYEGLFGWKFSSFIPNMVVFGTGESHIGGLMLADKVTPGDSPSLWFRVKNLDESIAKAQASGGTLVSETHEVPSVGWSAVVSDPDGNPVGLVMYTEDAL